MGKIFSNRKKRKLAERMSDEQFIRTKYVRNFNVEPDLLNPKTFNEKIQWLKLHGHTALHTLCADKVEVKDYVRGIIGDRHIIPTIFVTERPFELRPSRIRPDKFVVKTNHNSGGIVLCKDRRVFDWRDCRRKMRSWLGQDYYEKTRELQYRDIHRKILVEEFILNDDGSDVMDFKVFVFGGVARMILVDYDRFGSHKRNLYDTDWNLLAVAYRFDNIPFAIAEPDALGDLLAMAEALAKPFVFARVDFYLTGEQIYFGEITFHPGGGFSRFYPDSFDLKYGGFIEIHDRLCRNIGA